MFFLQIVFNHYYLFFIFSKVLTNKKNINAKFYIFTHTLTHSGKIIKI